MQPLPALGLERAMPGAASGTHIGEAASLVSRRLISDETRWLESADEFALELGGVLPGVTIAYRTWGSFRPDRVILVCHALTGNADADTWWEGMFGPGRAFDPDRHFVVCSNILGGCYGTTGPGSVRSDARRWGPSFPDITIRDIARAQAVLLQALGVEQVDLAIGGSLGGMVALEFGAIFPGVTRAVATIASCGRHSAWCIGLDEAQREAIQSDPAWKQGWYEPDAQPRGGLSVARMMAMCSYRNHGSFESSFGRKEQEPGLFAIASYLRHQGRKLVDRFDANSYLTITRAMDSHDLGRGREGLAKALRAYEPPTLVVTIPNDVLYPYEDQQQLAEHIPNARLRQLEGKHGHDSFLVEVETLSDMICEFMSDVQGR